MELLKKRIEADGFAGFRSGSGRRSSNGYRKVLPASASRTFPNSDMLMRVLELVTGAPVAQWIEHRTSNPVVVGSSPTGRATFSLSIIATLVGFGSAYCGRRQAVQLRYGRSMSPICHK